MSSSLESRLLLSLFESFCRRDRRESSARSHAASASISDPPFPLSDPLALVIPPMMGDGGTMRSSWLDTFADPLLLVGLTALPWLETVCPCWLRCWFAAWLNPAGILPVEPIGECVLPMLPTGEFICIACICMDIAAAAAICCCAAICAATPMGSIGLYPTGNPPVIGFGPTGYPPGLP